MIEWLKYKIKVFKAFVWWQWWIYISSILTYVIVGVLIHDILLDIKYWWYVPILLHLIFKFIYWVNGMYVANLTRKMLVIDGPQGAGKDLMTQIAIYYRYKDNPLRIFFRKLFRIKEDAKALTNVENKYNFGYGVEYYPLADYLNSMKPNTIHDFIKGKITKIDKPLNVMNTTYFAMDMSAYLPSFLDYDLKKLYPHFSLKAPLIRNADYSNVVWNLQVGSKLWVVVRDQANDYFIRALKTINHDKEYVKNCIAWFGDYIKVKIRVYERLEAFEQQLLPFKKIAILNEALGHIYLTPGGATKEQYIAQNGMIKELTLRIHKSKIKYDSHYFSKMIYN